VSAPAVAPVERGTTPELLYLRWEAQHWTTQSIGFSGDVADWECLSDEGRQTLRRTIAVFVVGEQAVTETLAPILDAAPHEDERIFLSTQVADEAKHVAFFRRLSAEVLHAAGTAGAARLELDPRSAPDLRTILDTRLCEAVESVRRAPRNLSCWAAAVTTYHLVIEGYLALAGLRNMLHFLRGTSLMPGLAAGLGAIARDESRHVAFGVLALRRRVCEEPGTAEAITSTLLDLAGPAVRVLVNPDNLLRLASLASGARSRRSNLVELRELALDSPARRLRAIGLPDSAVAEVSAEYRRHLVDVLGAVRGRAAVTC
jgi:ribonucleoside-diphosphate reductase beta chain